MTTEACIRMSKESGVTAALKQFGEIPRVRLPMSGDFLSKSIEDLPLSVRSRNALMRAGLYTVDKLTDYIKENGGLTGMLEANIVPPITLPSPEARPVALETAAFPAALCATPIRPPAVLWKPWPAA